MDIFRTYQGMDDSEQDNEENADKLILNKGKTVDCSSTEEGNLKQSLKDLKVSRMPKKDE